MKRIFVFALIFAMLVPCLVACKKSKTKVPENTTPAETTRPQEYSDKYAVYDDLGDLNFGGRTVTIANVDRTWYDDEVASEGFTGDIVKDAIFSRNSAVEERLNIEIESRRFKGPGVVQFAVVNNLEKDILAGTLTYDLVQSPS